MSKSEKLMHSHNKNIFLNSSQFWHLNKQGIKIVKVFTLLHSTDDMTGPFTWIERKLTKKIYSAFYDPKSKNNRRIPDNIVDKYIVESNSEILHFIGAPFRTLGIDTDAFLHFGSRKGLKYRRQIVMDFGSVFYYHV